jgi:phosphinothricin acetyltransferase
MVRMLRDAIPMQDAARLAEIYNFYVETDTATFEVETIGEAAMASRVAAVQAADLPYLVATDSLGVAGFAYAAPFHERAAYVHALTCSVYVDRAARGQGLGKALYRELLQRVGAISEGPHAPIRTLVALIALPNEASVALHESLGFAHVGTLAEVGFKFGRWIDVGYYQWSATNGGPARQV